MTDQRTALMTGGRGFIGQSVEHHLARRGWTVHHFDRTDGQDVRDADAVTDQVRTLQPQAIIHLAGVLGTSELFDDPGAAVQTNIQGTLNVLEAAWHHCLSTHVIGVTLPYIFPSIYRATKQGADLLGEAYAHRGLSVSHVRAFNAYGPAQKHGPGHPQKIVPTFATRAWRGEPLPIWGDGTQGVDLISADQIGRVFADVADLSTGYGCIYDAGTGAAVSVNWLAELIRDYTAQGSQIEYREMRDGEIQLPATVVQARGEGWEELGYNTEGHWRPVMDLPALFQTINAYKAW